MNKIAEIPEPDEDVSYFRNVNEVAYYSERYISLLVKKMNEIIKVINQIQEEE